MKKSFLLGKKLKKNEILTESSVEEIQNQIKDKGKNSEGVTNDMHRVEDFSLYS